MAGPAGLRLWPWLGLVLLLHAAGLEWLARTSETRAALEPMGPAMYTRLLQPAAPPPQPALPAKTEAAAVPQGVIAVAPPQAPASAVQAAPAREEVEDETAEAAAAAPETAAPETAAPEAVAPGAFAPEPASPEANAPEAVTAASAPDAAPEAPLPAPLPAPAATASAEPAGPDATQAVAAEAPPAPEPAAASASSPDPTNTTSAAAAAPTAASTPVAAWPADTRLNYRLGGTFRNGPISGDARVLWQREGRRYQVQVDLDITLWARMIITSQGEVTPDGLQPQAYEEVRPGRKRRGATFGREQVVLDNGSNAPRPPRMQDAASQFLELAHRFATGRETLAPGRTVDLWLGRPGGVDLWTYDVLALETLQTPGFGAVQAWRLKPRPVSKPRGKVSAEMWFAPSLHYLPVRIRLWMGDDAVIDLLAESIEQR